MMRLDPLKDLSDKKFFEVFDSWGSIYRSKYIGDPLSEYDILELQEKFLNNGIHHITVNDIGFGRGLVSRFLNSMRCYHDNAILSMRPDAANSVFSKDTAFADIYYDLMQGGYIDESRNLGFNDFFVENFYYDFMLIEACQELVDSNWFLKFFGSMKNNEVDRHIPVLVISYTKE